MKQLLSSLLARLTAGERAVLCTVLASSGSSPRGAGARMAVFSDGSTLGTIGGGAVEQIAAKQALDALKTGASSLRAFDLSPNQINDIGMICGGAVTVYYQVFSPQDEPAYAALQKWLFVLENEQAAWLYLALSGAAVKEFAVYTQDELPQDRPFGTKAQLAGTDPLIYTEPVCLPGRVVIFGGGHVGTALVPVLAAVDFRVTVYDNRPDFALPEHYPAAAQVIFGDYEKIEDHLMLTKDDYAVIMTPGHQADLAVLKQVLRTDARYIGCIGSRKKIERTNEALLQAGYSETAICRIHSPIGLDILAETPAEIAVSIAAELIRCRKETV